MKATPYTSILPLLSNCIRDDAPQLNSSDLYTFLNPYSYSLLRKSPALLKEFSGIYIDGQLLVSTLRLASINPRRMSMDFSSLAHYVFQEVERQNLRIGVIGSTPAAIDGFVGKLGQSTYKYANLVYSRHGYFSDDKERSETIESILMAEIDVLLVGMGTPLQELFLVDLRRRGWKGTGLTCGGFIHQTASHGEEYYPSFVNRLNIRWLYRIMDEPKLIKRYTLHYPASLLLLLRDIYTFHLHKMGR